MTRRQDRVNVLLRQEISSLLRTELRDPRLGAMVSVTRVQVSPDLRWARVYVSVMGDREAKARTIEGLRSAAGFLKRSLRDRLTMKNVPRLNFYLDESIEEGARLLELIDRMAARRAPEE